MDVVDEAIVAESTFGWISAVWSSKGLFCLSFGSPSPMVALDRMRRPEDCIVPRGEQRAVIKRVLAFLKSGNDDFLDLKLDYAGRTPFQRRVFEACRRISPGKTASYGELARKAKSPRAARAVGTAMANNRVPLIIPCHRVIAAGGKIGGFSAPDGIDMKRRLLAIESDSSTLKSS